MEIIPSDEINNFKLGQTFTTYEEVTKCFKLFCKKYYQPFVIRSRDRKQVIYKCCHGINKKSKSQPKDPSEHGLYNGCIAQINVYNSNNKLWKVTKLILEHNHAIGGQDFDDYSIRIDNSKKINNYKRADNIFEGEQKPCINNNSSNSNKVEIIIPNDIPIVKIETDNTIDNNNIINDKPIQPSYNLCKDQIFNSYDEAVKSVQKFCKENYQPFVIRTRSKKHIIYKCPQGIKATSNYTDCKAQINIYKNVKNTQWRISKFLLNHNHKTCKNQFKHYLRMKRNKENEPKLEIQLESKLEIVSPKLEIVSPPHETNFNNYMIISNNQEETITPSSDPLSDSIILNSNINEATSAVVVDQNICGNYTATNNDCNKNSDGNSVNINAELSDRDKFSIALDLTKNIAFILSGYQTNIYNKYIDELKLIQRNVKNGVSLLTINEGNSKFSSSSEYNTGMNESEIVLGKYECINNDNI